MHTLKGYHEQANIHMNTNLTSNAIDELSLPDLAALSASELALLQARLGEDERLNKARSEKLNAAFERRYAEAARAAYLGAGKAENGVFSGTIHLADAGFDVEVHVAKTVEWDEGALAKVLDGLPVETARHLARIKITVDERKFSAAPPDLQALLVPARTVKPGRMRFALKTREAA